MMTVCLSIRLNIFETKLKKVEETNKYITNDLNNMMKYISQLENYVYKLEGKWESNETDVDG